MGGRKRSTATLNETGKDSFAEWNLSKVLTAERKLVVEKNVPNKDNPKALGASSLSVFDA